MPQITVRTNMTSKELSSEFDEELCQTVADMLGKPLERVALEIYTDVRMMKAGKRSPAMLVNIASFDVFDPEKNKAYAPKILEFLKKSTGLTGDRLMVLFEPLEKTNIPALLI